MLRGWDRRSFRLYSIERGFWGMYRWVRWARGIGNADRKRGRLRSNHNWRVHRPQTKSAPPPCPISTVMYDYVFIRVRTANAEHSSCQIGMGRQHQTGVKNNRAHTHLTNTHTRRARAPANKYCTSTDEIEEKRVLVV